MFPLGWSSDGEQVYAATKGPPGRPEVWVVSARNGKATMLTSVANGVIVNGDVTPDGKYIVLEVAARNGDAWLVRNFDPRIK